MTVSGGGGGSGIIVVIVVLVALLAVLASGGFFWHKKRYSAVTGNEEGHQMDQEAANPRPNPIGAAGQEPESVELVGTEADDNISFHSCQNEDINNCV